MPVCCMYIVLFIYLVRYCTVLYCTCTGCTVCTVLYCISKQERRDDPSPPPASHPTPPHRPPKQASKPQAPSKHPSKHPSKQASSEPQAPSLVLQIPTTLANVSKSNRSLRYAAPFKLRGGWLRARAWPICLFPFASEPRGGGTYAATTAVVG